VANPLGVHGELCCQAVCSRLHAEEAAVGRQAGHVFRALCAGELAHLATQVFDGARVAKRGTLVAVTIEDVSLPVVRGGGQVDRDREARV
jgi:hypothetical protein